MLNKAPVLFPGFNEANTPRGGSLAFANNGEHSGWAAHLVIQTTAIASVVRWLKKLCLPCSFKLLR
jgi:hypothetical protein